MTDSTQCAGSCNAQNEREAWNRRLPARSELEDRRAFGALVQQSTPPQARSGVDGMKAPRR